MIYTNKKKLCYKNNVDGRLIFNVHGTNFPVK